MTNKSQNRIVKEKLVKKLTDDLASAKSVVLVDFAGMPVSDQQELKMRLREVGAKMMVVKNTLFKIAGKAAKAPKEALSDAVLAGQTALIISETDAISPLQVLGKFIKETDLPSMKVGIVEGSFQDKENLVKLTMLPGKEVLLSQVVGGIAAPMYGIVSVLNSKMQELIYILENAKGGETNG